MGDFKIERVTPDIILIRAPTKKKLAELLVRFQEYYESPIPEIKGKVFTLGQLKGLYATTQKGAYTYVGNSIVEGDWSGFNFPNYALEPFIRGLFDPLTEGEQDIVNMFRCRTDRFYIIGVNDEASAIDHEINHALYYIDERYKERVDDVLAAWDQVPAFKALLRDWGYCEEVLLDEIQAYVGADYEWLVDEHSDELVKFRITLSPEVRKALVAIKAELFSPLDPKYIQGVKNA